MAKRRNPYRPGTASYARLREASLRRRAALAQATAIRAASPGARRRAKQQGAAIERALREIERREEYRSTLNERERAKFDSRSIAAQMRLLAVKPDSIPKDAPDPFAGPDRDVLWNLAYATRAGIRPTSRE